MSVKRSNNNNARRSYHYRTLNSDVVEEVKEEGASHYSKHRNEGLVHSLAEKETMDAMEVTISLSRYFKVNKLREKLLFIWNSIGSNLPL